MFNNYFTSAFVDNTNTKSILLTEDSTSNSVISDISLPVQEVQSILEALKPEKATGPDEILARFLKETAPMNAPSSTVLFNRSLREGNIPSEWKLANIVPVHKKNEKAYVENYRPISLLGIVMERCVLDNTKEQLSRLISARQHGL